MSSDRIDRHELNEILRLFRALRVSRGAMLRARWGHSREVLTPNQIGVLMLLIEHPAGLRTGQIAALEHEDAGNITRAVAKLEEGGYVQKLATEADGRAVIIVATARGKALGAKLIQRRDQFLQDTFSKFSAQDRTQLLKALEAVNSALENAISPLSKGQNMNGKPAKRTLARTAGVSLEGD